MNYVSAIRRKIAATSGNTEFEKVFIKATFPKETNEPKLKHIKIMLKYLRGEETEITQNDGLSYISTQLKANIEDWVFVAKCYVIFHYALNDTLIAQEFANFIIRECINELGGFKQHGKPDKENNRHKTISSAYGQYITHFMKITQNQMTQTYEIFELSQEEYPTFINSKGASNILVLLTELKSLLSLALQVYQGHWKSAKQKVYLRIFCLVHTDVAKMEAISQIGLPYLLSKAGQLGGDKAVQLGTLQANLLEITGKIAQWTTELEKAFNYKFPEQLANLSSVSKYEKMEEKKEGKWEPITTPDYEDLFSNVGEVKPEEVSPNPEGRNEGEINAGPKYSGKNEHGEHMKDLFYGGESVYMKEGTPYVPHQVKEEEKHDPNALWRNETLPPDAKQFEPKSEEEEAVDEDNLTEYERRMNLFNP